MKHIKTFESYNSENVEPINEEFIGKILKGIIKLPAAALALIIMQFLDPRKVKDMVLPKLIDIYASIDVLIDTLENIHFNKTDITDVEAKKILDKINSLKKVKKKYPTLEDYKKAVCKWTPFLNFKNRNYLKSEIMKYQPEKMSADQVIKELEKVYKLITREDIIGMDVSTHDYEENFDEPDLSVMDQLNRLEDRLRNRR